MSLTRLLVRDLRNLSEVDLAPNGHLNIIQGENGSGKSSLLEAIHLLSTGKSQRTHTLNHAIREGASAFQINGWIACDRGLVPVVHRREPSQSILRIAGKSVSAASELARLMPSISISPETVDLIYGSPGNRRRFLDWGVFHVEPIFHVAWIRYQRALAQRNQALKSGHHTFTVWERELSEASGLIDQFRRHYIDGLCRTVAHLLSDWTDYGELRIDYRRGWDDDAALEAHLERTRSRDKRLGFTRDGPHRADLNITVAGSPAATRLSRGQVKIVTSLLWFAQVVQISSIQGRWPVLMIDDLVAELDPVQARKYVACVETLGCQAFITMPTPDVETVVGDKDYELFHVKQGKIIPGKTGK